MGIFRGVGGTGDSTDDGVVDAVTEQAVIATNKATEAATSATNAYNSAQSASTSKDTAITQANAAQSSANTASTHASNASTSATSAASSATSATASATTATTKASEASTSATNAATSETNAATSATTATTKASEAATSATTATTKAGEASTSATNAAASATSASTSASTATTKASEAATSAANAASSYDDFDDRYLGAKSSAPSTDNDGDALVTGALYFDTSSNAMKVWSGSAWLDAYASLSGALIATNNLSDLNNAGTARTNLGLGTAATTASTDYLASTGGTVTGTVELVSTDTSSSAAPILCLYRNSASPDDGDYLGQIKFQGESDTGVTRLFAKITAKTSDVTNGSEDGLIETAVKQNGSNVIVSRQTSSALKLINGTGLEVAGNITVDGTVDGRDVSADGTKLDGIEAGATADQTAAEIKTAYESNADTNAFTDADHTKLDGIEASADVTDTTNVVAALSAGTGISLSVGGVIANTSPDQTVSLTGAGTTTVSGTYPNFTITGAGTTYTAGTGITLTGTEFSIGQSVATTDSPTFAGLTTTADVSFGDSDKAVFGADSDLQIYHDGSNSFVRDAGTGNLRLQGTNLFLQNAGGTKNYLGAINSGAVTLYHDNAAKLATTSTGIEATGQVITDASQDAWAFRGTTGSSGNHSGLWFSGEQARLLLRDGTGNIKTMLAANGTDAENVINGNTIWHAGNDGSGSGLDADLLDGDHKSALYRKVSTANGTAGAGWITVAECTSGRKHGEVFVTDGESGDHTFIRIDWMRSYADTSFTVINSGGHQNHIKGIRVLTQTSNNTYGTKKLQVYVNTSSNYFVRIHSTGEVSYYSNLTAVTPVVQNSISGYSVQGTTINDLDDCALATHQGISCGGAIKVTKPTTTSDANATIISKGSVTSSSGNYQPVNWHIAFQDGAGVVKGKITSSYYSTQYSTSSDYRLKEDVVEIPDAAEKLKQLKPCNFQWVGGEYRTDGFLAHELQEVIPEAVTGVKDEMVTEEYEVTPEVLDDEGNIVTEAVMGTREVPEYQGIDQSKIVPILVKTVQDLLTKVEAQEARISELEAN